MRADDSASFLIYKTGKIYLGLIDID